jgi:tellurite methyltransferase
MQTFDDIYGKTEEIFYYGTEPTRELKDFLEENHPPRGEALDIGSGEGRNTLLLAQYGYHVHAVDYSAQGIRKLEKFVQAHNLHNIRYSIEDARMIKLESNSYSAIVAVTLLDHMTEEEGKKVASSLLSSLKPGGFIYIETFTIHDPAANLAMSKEEGQNISETAPFVKHFFEENELSSWFSELKIILYEEIVKYDDSHGEPHYHGLARLIGTKPVDEQN